MVFWMSIADEDGGRWETMYSRLTLKMSQNLRGYFLRCKADDEGMLPHGEEDNAAARKTDRKGGTVLELADYTTK